MSEGEHIGGMGLMQRLIELRIRAHEGAVTGRSEARREYERLLQEAVADDPFTSWQDLDTALRIPYKKALKERGAAVSRWFRREPP